MFALTVVFVLLPVLVFEALVAFRMVVLPLEALATIPGMGKVETFVLLTVFYGF